MLEAYAHAAMVDVYLSGQEGPETSWHSHETAGSEGFAITLFTSPRWFTPRISNV
jgi:hypothetical protein